MPSNSDVRPTSHDRHDALLVAALAAGDLSAVERDRATVLIETCPDCATLHDDLLAIARATATVPPPIAIRPRDFRLSREQAARLRPSGWRRVLGAFGSPGLAFTKPLGIGLTTIGLAGLLLGNVSFGGFGGFGGAAAMPAPAAAASAPAARAANDGTTESGPTSQPRALGDGTGSGAQLGPLASGVPAPAAVPPSPAPSAATSDRTVRGGAEGSSGDVTGAGGPKATAADVQASRDAGGTLDLGNRLSATDPDLRTLILVGAILVGLGLLVLRRIARSVTAP
ncbi:MAG TPA: hypothetical protein VFY18_09740 [Candidatus Limnocylindrales bacterium]|nr:hypothetical protein [Candidatus Limnocylindrales bacterium]